MPRAYFHTEFSEEFMEKVEECIMTCLGYDEADLPWLEVFTIDDLIKDYEEMLKDMLGEDLWEKLSYYIDIEAMIRDDVLSGYIFEIKVDGQTLYVRER